MLHRPIQVVVYKSLTIKIVYSWWGRKENTDRLRNKKPLGRKQSSPKNNSWISHTWTKLSTPLCCHLSRSTRPSSTTSTARQPSKRSSLTSTTSSTLASKSFGPQSSIARLSNIASTPVSATSTGAGSTLISTPGKARQSSKQTKTIKITVMW